MLVDAQWPLQVNTDLTSALLRLADAFVRCFDMKRAKLHVWDGQVHDAIHCGQAYAMGPSLQKKRDYATLLSQ